MLTPSKISSDSLNILDTFDESIKSYMKWFLAFTEIPRPTFSCGQISQKIFDWCNILGVSTTRDQYGNVYVQIPSNSNKPDLPTLAIQAHMDIVFAGHYVNGKILVKVREEGNHKIIYSDTSTLGADDGFGLALMFDIIEKRDTFKHPPLEFIFTIDEELGLVGAHQAQPNVFKYKYYINCDSLDGSAIFIGSAGGNIFDYSLFPIYEPISDEKSQNLLKITIDGLKGGHSGSQIHLGRANASKLLGRIFVSLLSNNISFQIATINAGNYPNVICNFAETIIYTKDIEQTKSIISHCESQFISEFSEKDTIHIKAEIFNPNDLNSNDQKFEKTIMTLDCSQKFSQFLNNIPSGVFRYHPDFEGSVESSQNLGIVKAKENGEIFFSIFMRSAVQSQMDKAEKDMNELIDNCGIRSEKKFWVAGSPWSPNLNNELAKIVQKSYKEVTGQEKKLGLTHVTIEPSEFLARGYSPEMVSICPSIPKAHSVGEWMEFDEAQIWVKTVYNVIEHIEKDN